MYKLPKRLDPRLRKATDKMLAIPLLEDDGKATKFYGREVLRRIYLENLVGTLHRYGLSINTLKDLLAMLETMRMLVSYQKRPAAGDGEAAPKPKTRP